MTKFCFVGLLPSCLATIRLHALIQCRWAISKDQVANKIRFKSLSLTESKLKTSSRYRSVPKYVENMTNNEAIKSEKSSAKKNTVSYSDPVDSVLA